MNKNFILFLSLLLLNQITASGQKKQIDQHFFGGLDESHDVRVGKWGPYSKQYAGISHLPELKSGIRFDFFVAPGYYRNKVLIPNVLFESGYFPWYANMEQQRYAYRYELEWKDQVFTDVTYQVINENTVLAEIACVNNTSLPQNLAVNLMATLNYPELWPKLKLVKPLGSVWVNAADYQSLNLAKSNPKDNLVTDGLMKGEIRNADFLDGTGLSKRFGQNPGDEVAYNLPLNFKKGFITLLYRSDKNRTQRLACTAFAEANITLTGSGEISQMTIPFDAKGASKITLKSLGGDGIELNGLLFSKVATSKTLLTENAKDINPEKISADQQSRQIILKYSSVNGYYGMTWDDALFKIREIRNDELDVFFRKMVHNHVDSIIHGNDKGNFENVFIRPVEIAPKSKQTIKCLITYGDSEQAVKQNLTAFKTLKEQTNIHAENNLDLASGAPYAFSQKMLKSALMENIVYPIYTQRQYIRHFTPGKWWNSLYTWDSGFIALGLTEVDIQRAAECINAYTTKPGSQSAFIHHGSPVPVQVYAFLDLWNKTQSKPLLQYFYPRLKQYYCFLAGKSGSSSTRNLKSSLLKTWDYFYNSGGWDDYPAQLGVHAQKLESTVSPVITTAQCIRFAKIMKMAAEKTGNKADISMYSEDIRTFTAALQKFSWNEKSGYFSYVKHDASGNAIGPFNHKDGVDYNMGLDGAYPLLSGICNPDQIEILIDKIFSPEHMWTASGIGVVDQSAPYYQKDGYWNGSVWMPHQWFMWKTMLDLGRPDLAMKISKTGLEVFKNETDNSYYTFEHYLSKSGRGAGWHQFSGLSTPVLSWYNASYKQGTVTTGFEIWLDKSVFNTDFSHYDGKLSFDDSTTAHQRSLLICLNPNKSYEAWSNGKIIKVDQLYPGLICLTFPASNENVDLVIRPRK